MGKRTKEKDQAMAAMMKALGIERTSARCPVCHVLTSLRSLYMHIATACRGGRAGT